MSRLRTAATTLATLLVAAGLLVGVAALLGQPITAALPGVVVAMIATIAVNDPTARGRALSTACLVPAAAATAALSAALGTHRAAGIVVFVAVAVAAVFAQRLGPRGVAVGMVGFIAYFLVMFLRTPAAQIPVTIGAVALGAAVSLGMRTLLRPRHPDRELRRMLSALTVRAATVVNTLADAVCEQTWNIATARRLRARLDRATQTTLGIEDRLDAAEESLLASISNRALSVRVFDVQLGLEQLTTRVIPLLTGPDLPEAARDEAAGHLYTLHAALLGDDRSDPHRWARLAQRLEDVHGTKPSTPEVSDGTRHGASDTARRQMESLRHTLTRLVDSWRRAVTPAELAPIDSTQASETDPTTDEDEDSDSGEDDGAQGRDDKTRSTPFSETVRRAVQVAVATALAIGVGELLSPTRWFWAVIAAFVVFTGASSRGQVLSKGWQRVAGTVTGVFAGVAVAALVGDNAVLAIALIGVCLFLGLYLMAVASGLMMFFITTLLALVYGLLGQFSVDLLLLRLEETAAGAAIGVAVSFLLLPTRTRPAVAAAVADFLADLPEVLDDAAATLTEQPDSTPPTGSHPSSGLAPARVLRQTYAALRTTARPLTDGLAGVVGRSGFQRTQGIVGACEHHARALARLAHHHPGVGAAPTTRDALHQAADAVGAHARALGDSLDTTLMERAGPAPAAGSALDPELDTLDDAARHAGRADLTGASVAPRGASTITVITAAARHLRAIDQAVAELAAHLDHTGGAP